MTKPKPKTAPWLRRMNWLLMQTAKFHSPDDDFEWDVLFGIHDACSQGLSSCAAGRKKDVTYELHEQASGKLAPAATLSGETAGNGGTTKSAGSRVRGVVCNI